MTVALLRWWRSPNTTDLGWRFFVACVRAVLIITTVLVVCWFQYQYKLDHHPCKPVHHKVPAACHGKA